MFAEEHDRVADGLERVYIDLLEHLLVRHRPDGQNRLITVELEVRYAALNLIQLAYLVQCLGVQRALATQRLLQTPRQLASYLRVLDMKEHLEDLVDKLLAQLIRCHTWYQIAYAIHAKE